MDNIKEYFYPEDKRNVILVEQIDSTNNYAKELARNGEPSGTVIIAETQTAGKGRLGRSFCSPPGTGLYMSIILRPRCAPEKISLLTSCMAVAASRAIDDLYKTNMKIKWVNDLYLNGRKISGILTEGSVNANGKAEFAVIGIGINVRTVKNYFSQELLQSASSLEDETGKVVPLGQIAAKIVYELEKMLPEFENAGFIYEYRKRSCIIGCEVVISKQGREPTAKAVGIDDMAGLVVEYSDGSRETLTSGEARIKKDGQTFL